ncbi:P-loop containing nucleoside triphosphate hydrolase protein [Daldinia caldariorum]|uniref:P-loop containing nucleoside triphosphate hydrolase protein n=1 Tax=Daldinia caldariorum TaxID=326644 RepID=UPI0020083A15|nr:P-loop containing nucleoside triphosphate hydrolase protein [Daldinia caldariorum]KAI1465903.1 P-loop containing nucleoside triphosphate hydrolase protein [Daldinia caldariorum]
MATNKRSPTPDRPSLEDPDTAAARKELRQTVISEKPDLSIMSAAKVDPAPDAATSGDKPSGKDSTPGLESLDARNDSLKNLISSPKKKRARDEVDVPNDAASDGNGDVSPIAADATISEPEKKRPRDVSSEYKAKADALTASDSKDNGEAKTDSKNDTPSTEKQAVAKDDADTAEKSKATNITSSSAFSSSGIAGFASQASPFLQSGSKTLSSFASPSGSQSPFGATASTSTTSIFGSSSLSNGASPFGQVGGASKPFGSTIFGGTFSGKLGESKLTSFGKPGEAFKSNQPTRPFGAPVSEEEDNNEEEDGSSGDENRADKEDKDASEEKTAADDKKKPKLQRVVVDDGEAGEATILQVRAKIFHLDKASSSWKERGAGNLKINVPIACVDIDEESGAAIPGSFDASGLDTADSKVVRLIMRQDSTHRVILNTAIIPAMHFQEKSTVKATYVLFTAIEDEGAVSIQVKMNTANAKSFLNEVGKIQRELHASGSGNAEAEAPSADAEGHICDGEKNNKDVDNEAPISEQELPPYTESEDDSNQLPQPSSKESEAGGFRKEVSDSPNQISRSSSGASIKRKLAELDDPLTRSKKIRPDASSYFGERSQTIIKRKRKRQTSEEDKEDDHPGNLEETLDEPSVAKSRKNLASQRKKKANEVVECQIEWPQLFKDLDKTHRALNLVFTFCSTRRHLATTFDTIRSAVESNTKRELIVEDVAAIVALRPEGINFTYVDEVMLHTDIKGAERDTTFKTGRSRNITVQGPAPDASVGGLTGMEELGSRHPDDLPPGGQEVLYFEFVDEDLKRQVQSKKTGEPINPNRRLRDDDLKMPVYSQKQLTALIEKRNQKFTNAVMIRQEAEAYIPVPSVSSTATPMPEQSTIPESIPKERKSIPEIIQELKDSPWYTGQIVPDGHRVFDAQEPVFGELDFLLSQDMVNALYNAKGITQFYAHQAEAINNLHAGRHVVVSTSTSSGKSLIYQLPVLHALEQDPNTRAIYIFPTKALAQDQKKSLKEMLAYFTELGNVLVETFDGDTPMHDRNQIRDEARIIFTNPDMLHLTILPQEDKWRTFLKHLRYVVVDELHYYNGLMGSHVAFIMRRLRRICAAVGNRKVKFISCSATVANPQEHFKTIFGIDDVHLVDFDGSPSGRKEFLCWNTPYKDPGDPSSGRGNAIAECARLFCQLILRGVRVIAFCRVRKQCEELVNAVRYELESLGRPECTSRVMGYRGGYTAQDRRRIESEMFEGKLMGIVATTALELGVDIGTLDCVITLGFPYTIANLRQQSGRAGRRNKDSLSVLVGDCFPADQHYMQNPDELFTKPNCELQVDLDNILVLEGHIQCAAYEMPINPAEDAIYFSKDLAKIAEERLIKDELGYYHCHDRFRPMPSRFVAIRDTEDDHFAIVDISHGQNVVLEELEASRAFFTIYDGAIFLHQGNSYLVRDFQPDRKIAKVEKVKVEWTTQQRDFTDVDPVETEAIRKIPGSPSLAFHGSMRIVQNVFGYFKVDRKRRILDAVQVDNPPIIRHSKGMWLDVPKRALEVLVYRRLHVAGAIHAAEHAIISLMPNFVISLPDDVRTECKSGLKEFARKETSRKRPARLTFYDAKGGANGAGISTKAFEFIELLLLQALERVQHCHCQTGCPECVCSEFCQEANEVMSKAGSTVIIKALLNMEIDVEALPMGPEDMAPVGIETVVLAKPVPSRFDFKEIKIEEDDDQGCIVVD